MAPSGPSYWLDSRLRGEKASESGAQFGAARYSRRMKSELGSHIIHGRCLDEKSTDHKVIDEVHVVFISTTLASNYQTRAVATR